MKSRMYSLAWYLSPMAYARYIDSDPTGLPHGDKRSTKGLPHTIDSFRSEKAV